MNTESPLPRVGDRIQWGTEGQQGIVREVVQGSRGPRYLVWHRAPDELWTLLVWVEPYEHPHVVERADKEI